MEEHDVRNVMDTIAKGMAAVARIPLHYGAKILHDMTRDRKDLKVHTIHTLANGDRMVVEWDQDPNWVYEVVIYPLKREEIDWNGPCKLRK